MKIDYEKIKTAFPERAWVYAEGYDAVTIGKWADGRFTVPLDEDCLTLLRVFDDTRELLFSGDTCRDTADYNADDYIPELAEAGYYMYGEQAEAKDGMTVLREDRGGDLVFPAELSFPKTDNLPEGAVALILRIRNFVRYNPIPVLPISGEYDAGLKGNGALEVVDYAYTGFSYADGKAVEL